MKTSPVRRSIMAGAAILFALGLAGCSGADFGLPKSLDDVLEKLPVGQLATYSLDGKVIEKTLIADPQVLVVHNVTATEEESDETNKLLIWSKSAPKDTTVFADIDQTLVLASKGLKPIADTAAKIQQINLNLATRDARQNLFNTHFISDEDVNKFAFTGGKGYEVLTFFAPNDQPMQLYIAESIEATKEVGMPYTYRFVVNDEPWIVTNNLHYKLTNGLGKLIDQG